MSQPVIISCALTGAGDTTGVSPYVPVTPEQIATEALAAHAAGASIVHIHVRDPETGKPSLERDHYRETVRLIRDAKSKVIINLTTGAGSRFVPDDNTPNSNALPGGIVSIDERIAHVLELKPEICSLDIGTVNFSKYAFINVPKHVEQIAESIRDAGVKPELEVFDLGHIALANHLCKRGLFASPPWFQFCLGIPWGAPASAEVMLAMKQMVPAEALWSAFGISSHQFPMVAQAVILGGHVRVGLEDNLFLAKGELAPGNASLVSRAARIIHELGSEVATADQARSLLGL
jgi:uncharacterized protein (DUF849 family)